MDREVDAVADDDVEIAIAGLLGAPAEVAAAAVETVRSHGLLAHGVLFLSVLASARWGADAVEALTRFAGGQEPPSSWSDYEERTALEEAQEEALGALSRLEAGDLHAPLSDQVRAALTAYARGARR